MSGKGRMKPVFFREGKDEVLLAWAEAHPNFSAWVRAKIQEEMDPGSGPGPSGGSPDQEELRAVVERIVQELLTRRQTTPDQADPDRPKDGPKDEVKVKQEVAEDVADLVAAML